MTRRNRVFRESDVTRDAEGQFATRAGTLPNRQRGNRYGKYEWRFSHDVSRDVTTHSARLMGMPYRRDASAGRSGSSMLDTTPGQRRRFAISLLKKIDESSRSGKTLKHPVYHGTQQKRFANARVGDIVKIPLTATSYYRGMAHGFTIGKQGETERMMFADNADELLAKAPRGTLLSFPQGTPYVSINQAIEGQDERFNFNWVEQEALVAGTFRVKSVTRQDDGLDIVELEQVSTFAPETSTWTRAPSGRRRSA